jgi:hypothetical protein
MENKVLKLITLDKVALILAIVSLYVLNDRASIHTGMPYGAYYRQYPLCLLSSAAFALSIISLYRLFFSRRFTWRSKMSLFSIIAVVISSFTIIFMLNIAIEIYSRL